MTDNTFQLSGFALPGVNADPFGLWEVVPASRGVSFAVGEVAQPEEPIHRVNFAAADEGRALLQLKRRDLQEQEALLQQAEQRLAQIAQAGGVSFAAPLDQPPEFVQPTQTLEAALQRLMEPVSYGLFDRRKQAEQEGDLEATSQWRRFLEQVREMMAHYAHVETAIAGVPIGRTAVGWMGDFRTTWIPTVTSDDMALHRHNVAVTLQWRRGTLRFVGVVGAGAANIAVKLGMPGGQWLALPAVWNFVKDVLAEWRKLQAIKRQ
ncbi:hypothetical protein TFLX_02324 [Thermoflexales bacterium]|nr:hypothetical protein TFLX_02324 [Thermoflexales bacterium]